STFLRILNRMHEMVPTAALAGQVLLDGVDVYDSSRRGADAPRPIGMVVQKANPFPAPSIYRNVRGRPRRTGPQRGPSGQGGAGGGVVDQGRPVAGGPRPAPAARRSTLRRAAATVVHRPVAGRPASGTAHG